MDYCGYVFFLTGIGTNQVGSGVNRHCVRSKEEVATSLTCPSCPL